jgi:hypothetical protein
MKDDNRLTVYVHVDRNCAGYCCFECRPQSLDSRANYPISLDGHPEHNLMLYGQSNVEEFHDQSIPPARRVYAVEVLYQTGRSRGMTHRELETGAMTVKAINRKMAKIEAQAGPPLSFGASVQRFATAVGAKTVTLKNSNEARQVTGEHYFQVKTSEAAWRVDLLIRDMMQPYIRETA